MGRRRRRGDWAEGGRGRGGAKGAWNTDERVGLPGICALVAAFEGRPGAGRRVGRASWLPLTWIPASQVGTLKGERLRGN